MSFSASMEEGSMSIDGSILKARLMNMGGEAVDAEIDLNTCLGNENGMYSTCVSHFLSLFYPAKVEASK